jgi:hypothetical protein
VEITLDEVRAYLECTGAAYGLDGGDALFDDSLVRCAKQ